MFREVFWFEFRQQVRSKWTWICVLLLALLVYRDVAGAYWDQLTGTGRVARNSAYATYYILLFATFWTNILAAAFFPAPFLRDIKSRMAPIAYATQVSHAGYFWGKYLASLCVMVAVSTGSVWGFASVPVAAHTLHIVKGEYGPILWTHLAHAWLLIILPAVLLHGAVHSLLAVRTGKLAGSYVYCIVHTMLWVVVMIAYPDTAAPHLVQLLDPIGKTTLEGQLFYWSAEQRGHGFLAWTGPLLWNRLLTLGCFVLVLILVSRSFQFSRMLSFLRTNERRRMRPPVPHVSVSAAATLKPPARNFTMLGWFQVIPQIGLQEFLATMRHPALRIVLAIGLILCWMSSSHLGSYAPLDHGVLLPVFGDAFPLAASVFFIAILIAMLYFTGEIFARERSDRMASLVGSSPVPDYVLIAGKGLAMALLAAALSLVPVAGFLITQTTRGFFHPEWGLLATRVILNLLIPMLGFGALAAAMHSVVSNRAAAHALTMLTAISIVAMSEVHVLENPLLLPFMPIEGTLVSAFGIHRQEYLRLIDFDLYWLALTLLLLVLAWFTLQRGNERAWSQRNRRTHLVGLAYVGIAVVFAAGTAAIVHRSIAVENTYRSRDAQNREAAEYEKKYGLLDDLPQPHIVHAEYAADIYNGERAAQLHATFTVQNDSAESIAQVHLETAPHALLKSVAWGGVSLAPISSDLRLRHFVYTLPTALSAHASAVLDVTLQVRYAGFAASGLAGTITQSAAVLSPDLWPHIGYDPERELKLDGDRRRWGLSASGDEPNRAIGRTPQAAYLDAPNCDRYTWHLTVTADAGQVVSAPGSSRSFASEPTGGRRSWNFTSDAALPWSLYIATANYATAADTWKEPGTASAVDIQVDSLPQHAYNVVRYLDSAKYALSYLTRRFGPYPYKTLHITEAPEPFLERTVSSGNLILIPELDGWVHDYRRTVALDWIQFQVANEIAKAWWGQKIAPSAAPGGRLISEGVPAYLALEVLGAKGGEAQVRSFRSSLEDHYLRRSALEEHTEPSLAQWNDEAYLANKAPLMLYGIRERMGEGWLLGSLRAFIEQENEEPVHAAGLVDQLIRNAPADTKAEICDDLLSASVYDASLVYGDRADASDRLALRRFAPVGRDNRAEVATERTVLVTGARAGQEILKTRIKADKRGTSLPLSPSGTKLVADPSHEFIDLNRGNNSLRVY